MAFQLLGMANVVVISVKLHLINEFIMTKRYNFATSEQTTARMTVSHIKCVVLFLLLSVQTICLCAKDFVLVIDAGHGGHDPGAVGMISKEKNINLNVALAFGRLVERGCPDVRVIYTRKTDVFVPLNRRAQIANEAKADLFISIHTKSVAGNKSAKGASTWTLGLAKTESNLDVAKRENSVILYEDDYKQVYSGFNPYSSESYIIFELMQDQYMEQSVHLASMIQRQFKDHSGRADRGVHQAGFLVLKASAMPSVLVELGFISTPTEEKYLNTDTGVNSLSKAIYNAFLEYKEDWACKNSGTTAPKVEAAPVADVHDDAVNRSAGDDGGLVFKVQFMASRKRLDTGDSRFEALGEVECYEEDGIYKYTCHASPDYDHVSRMRRQVAKTYRDAFVVAFKDGQRVDTAGAIKEFRNKK